jgi:uncharacterized delta-60 repeat protein
VTLNSEILSAPLSPTEADRFFAVTATTGNQYYATGFTTVADDNQMALARFRPTGGLNTSFGPSGITTVNVAIGAGKKAELARSVVVQSDGKIVIAGPIEHDTAATGDAARDTDIAVARFDTTGQLDQTFGTNGIRRLDLSTGTVSGTAFRGDTVWELTLLPGDSLLIIGGKLTEGAGRTDTDYAVMKLTSNGTVDTTFGTNGLVTVVHVALLAFVAEAYDVAFQGQNLIIVGYGRNTSPGTVDIISARFLTDGTWDKTYGERRGSHRRCRPRRPEPNPERLARSACLDCGAGKANGYHTGGYGGTAHTQRPPGDETQRQRCGPSRFRRRN